MNQIKAIGFDLDNTLYAQTQEIKEIIEGNISTKASELLGVSKDLALRDYLQYHSELQSGRRSLMHMGINEGLANIIVEEAVVNSNILNYLERDQRLVDMLNNLKIKYELFLITTSTKDNSINKLNALGIVYDIFDPRLYRDSQYLRDDGSAFKYITGYLNLNLDELMFVGDREKIDIIPAKKLGVTTAIVNAKSEHADYQLEEIYDLEKILLT